MDKQSQWNRRGIRFRLILAVILSLCGLALPAHAGPAATADKPLKVFVLIGQSNMTGSGQRSNLPATLRNPQANVLSFRDGKWTPLAPRRHFGPEISFAQTMSEEFKEPIGIIKFCRGGTNLARQWNPYFGRNLYSRLNRIVASARDSRPIEIAGIVWMQGERDSVYEDMAWNYSRNFELFIECVREDLGNANLPFVFGRINPVAPKYRFVDIVRHAQENVRLPFTAMIDCDNLPKHEDAVHYNAQGQVVLGQKFAQAMLALIKEKGGFLTAGLPAEKR